MVLTLLLKFLELMLVPAAVLQHLHATAGCVAGAAGAGAQQAPRLGAACFAAKAACCADQPWSSADRQLVLAPKDLSRAAVVVGESLAAAAARMALTGTAQMHLHAAAGVEAASWAAQCLHEPETSRPPPRLHRTRSIV